jgi:hypothetical protein
MCTHSPCIPGQQTPQTPAGANAHAPRQPLDSIRYPHLVPPHVTTTRHRAFDGGAWRAPPCLGAHAPGRAACNADWLLHCHQTHRAQRRQLRARCRPAPAAWPGMTLPDPCDATQGTPSSALLPFCGGCGRRKRARTKSMMPFAYICAQFSPRGVPFPPITCPGAPGIPPCGSRRPPLPSARAPRSRRRAPPP